MGDYSASWTSFPGTFVKSDNIIQVAIPDWRLISETSKNHGLEQINMFF